MLDNPIGLIAHPDDEVLFLWPMLGYVKEIIAVVSDADNPKRGGNREQAFKEVGELYGFKATCIGIDSEFYRLPTRDRTLKDLMSAVMESVHFDTPIFTHNQFGEYGNIDHMLVHQLAVHTGQKVYFTDIVQEANWLPFSHFPQALRNKYTYHGEFARNNIKSKQAEEIYRKHGCWTWSRQTPGECRVYSI